MRYRVEKPAKPPGSIPKRMLWPGLAGRTSSRAGAEGRGDLHRNERKSGIVDLAIAFATTMSDLVRNGLRLSSAPLPLYPPIALGCPKVPTVIFREDGTTGAGCERAHSRAGVFNPGAGPPSCFPAPYPSEHPLSLHTWHRPLLMSKE